MPPSTPDRPNDDNTPDEPGETVAPGGDNESSGVELDLKVNHVVAENADPAFVETQITDLEIVENGEDIQKILESDQLWECEDVRRAVQTYQQRMQEAGVDWKKQDPLAYIGFALQTLQDSEGKPCGIPHAPAVQMIATQLFKGGWSNIRRNGKKVRVERYSMVPQEQKKDGVDNALQSVSFHIDDQSLMVQGIEAFQPKDLPSNQVVDTQKSLRDGDVVVDRLGAGRQGDVFLVLRKGRLVVVKVMLNTADLHLQKRFTAEALAMKYLDGESGQPRFLGAETVVNVADQNQGFPAYSMEYTPGLPLGTFLKETGELPIEHAHSLVLAGMASLEKDHNLVRKMGNSPIVGVIHRDLKPGNVLIGPDGRLRTIDYGLTEVADFTNTQTRDGQIFGTPAYWAPEQEESDAESKKEPKIDVWAWGCIYYQMLTGEPPFGLKSDCLAIRKAFVDGDAQTIQSIKEPLESRGVPEKIVNLILNQLLNPVPSRRLSAEGAVIEMIKVMPQLRGRFKQSGKFQKAPELHRWLVSEVTTDSKHPSISIAADNHAVEQVEAREGGDRVKPLDVTPFRITQDKPYVLRAMDQDPHAEIAYAASGLDRARIEAEARRSIHSVLSQAEESISDSSISHADPQLPETEVRENISSSTVDGELAATFVVGEQTTIQDIDEMAKAYRKKYPKLEERLAPEGWGDQDDSEVPYLRLDQPLFTDVSGEDIWEAISKQVPIKIDGVRRTTRQKLALRIGGVVILLAAIGAGGTYALNAIKTNSTDGNPVQLDPEQQRLRDLQVVITATTNQLAGGRESVTDAQLAGLELRFDALLQDASDQVKKHIIAQLQQGLLGTDFSVRLDSEGDVILVDIVEEQENLQKQSIQSVIDSVVENGLEDDQTNTAWKELIALYNSANQQHKEEIKDGLSQLQDLGIADAIFPEDEDDDTEPTLQARHRHVYTMNPDGPEGDPSKAMELEIEYDSQGEFHHFVMREGGKICESCYMDSELSWQLASGNPDRTGKVVSLPMSRDRLGKLVQIFNPSESRRRDFTSQRGFRRVDAISQDNGSTSFYKFSITPLGLSDEQKEKLHEFVLEGEYKGRKGRRSLEEIAAFLSLSEEDKQKMYNVAYRMTLEKGHRSLVYEKDGNMVIFTPYLGYLAFEADGTVHMQEWGNENPDTFRGEIKDPKLQQLIYNILKDKYPSRLDRVVQSPDDLHKVSVPEEIKRPGLTTNAEVYLHEAGPGHSYLRSQAGIE